MTTFDTDRTESRVGERTSVVVLHRGTETGPGTFENYGSRLYLLAEPGRQHWEPEKVPGWWPADLCAVPISNRDFTAPVNRLLRFHRLDPTWATTGTLTLWVMHSVFPEAHIRLTGTSLLVKDVRKLKAFEHAWGSSVVLTAEHRLAEEGRLLRQWVNDGWLTVVS
jgi:hypothetical protein